jgi:hypothetical protein
MEVFQRARSGWDLWIKMDTLSPIWCFTWLDAMLAVN